MSSAVIYQQALTEIYKHAKYLAIHFSTKVKTGILQHCVMVLTLSSQRPDEILAGWSNLSQFCLLAKYRINNFKNKCMYISAIVLILMQLFCDI